MTPRRKRPPFFYLRLFERLCKDELFEELQGDLEQEFNQNLRAFGERKARWIYRKEVLKMIRPSVIKKASNKFQSFNPTIMFKNYSLVAFRNIIRNKLFSSINIIGLSISMAVGLIAITFMTEINSYDKFHENGNQIYRVVSDIVRPNQPARGFATAPLLVGEELTNNFAGIDHVVTIQRSLYGSFEHNNDDFSATGIFTNNAFFDVFSFDMIQGNPSTALDDPSAVVLTESVAMKIFGRTDVLGETLNHSRYEQMMITGVVKDPPNNSHIKFEAIASTELLKARSSSLLTRWSQSTAGYTYVLIPEGYEVDRLQDNLDQISKAENDKFKSYEVHLGLEALLDIFPHTGKSNQFGIVMPSEIVNNIIILAAIVILSACFNYTNLSMARSLKRAKEVGVRKVVGARRGQLLVQFMTEAIVVSTLALFIAIMLFKIIRPEFLMLNLFIERTTNLALSGKIYLYFFFFATVVGALSGTIPALFMSKLKPTTIMKGVPAIKASKGIDLKKILTTAQFTLSMGFLILVTLVYKQYKFSLNYDLGFATENILNIETQGNDTELLRAAFTQIPEVSNISTSSMTASTGQYQSDYAKHDDALDSTYTLTFDVSPEYISNLGHQIVAGKSFSNELRKDHVVVTELLVKSLGISSNQEAVDEFIQFNGQSYSILGVVKDFQARTITSGLMTPFVFTSERQHSSMQLKISTDDIMNTMAKLESAWSEVDNKNSFKSIFYDDEIKRAYNNLSSSVKTYGFLAGIAVSISILGLLGMAVYTTESKGKELSIRKVLGASVASLVQLLSRSFMTIFVVSAALAIPTAYLIFKRTVAAESAYSIGIGFWELSAGAILIMIIALFTISSQTLKAAKSNPAERLRDD